MRKIALVGLAVLAASGIACSSGTGTKSSVGGGNAQPVQSATAAPSTAVAAVGQTVNLSYDGLSDKTAVEVTVANPKQYKVEPGEFGSKPEHGVFLVLDVTVVCKQGSYDANPFDFKFVAQDGTVSEGAITASFDPALHATGLSTGQKVAGKIVFDIPPAALTGGRIQVAGLGLDFDKPGAYWTL
jgi:methionine-rich copper-binding protein CopC